MNRIKLLVGNELFSDGKKVLKGERLFYDPYMKVNFKKFSVLVLYAREFDLNNCKRLVETYSFPMINDMVFIVGNEREKFQLKNEFSGDFLPWIRVGVNQQLSNTFYSSLKTGLRSISRRTEYIILQFGTMADIKHETVSQLMRGALKSKKDIIIPIFEDKRGHPILFSHSLLPILFSLRKEKGLPYILRKYKDSIEEIPVQDKNILKK